MPLICATSSGVEAEAVPFVMTPASTRSGCSAASTAVTSEPHELPTTMAFSMPRPSRICTIVFTESATEMVRRSGADPPMPGGLTRTMR